MPIDYGRYPDNWLTEIRPRILARAGNVCEWCGVPNHVLIVRSPVNPVQWSVVDGLAGEVATLDCEKTTWVVLTIAHLGTPHADGRPGDKHDVRDENLAALCQRCHLLHDLPDHMRHAAETRRRKRAAMGQAALPLALEG